MKLEMKDTPGQLVAALKPISAVGGNIIAVIHQRDTLSTAETLDVQIVLELPEGRLETLLGLLKEQGVSVVRIGEQRLLHQRSLILIGHLMHTDLSDTVDRIDQTGFAEVTEISLVMPAINEPSSARITVRSVDLADMHRALDILRSVAGQKQILMIEPLEAV
ncbi:amino acid-binding protein [Methanoculleus sp. FWC-SCC1]|uniref:Amino acid-binding protein n=1 Tax=Methanoculleus frigidifontis TaxID=2584085 RepID=A0ABT8M609_9EURY|nr:amino acid-binding protein [Methanoculleus sp. FWC-SCC1]MDN7023371.1 amino acid-binding protein [Methanoculleus sp. FWC-SCC1]